MRRKRELGRPQRGWPICTLCAFGATSFIAPSTRGAAPGAKRSSRVGRHLQTMAARGLMVLAVWLLECHTASALAMHLVGARLFLPAPRLPPPALAMRSIHWRTTRVRGSCRVGSRRGRRCHNPPAARGYGVHCVVAARGAIWRADKQIQQEQDGPSCSAFAFFVPHLLGSARQVQLPALGIGSFVNCSHCRCGHRSISLRLAHVHSDHCIGHCIPVRI
mgnify:CR=1 FL=1